jgi:hypothetical protein
MLTSSYESKCTSILWVRLRYNKGIPRTHYWFISWELNPVHNLAHNLRAIFIFSSHLHLDFRSCVLSFLFRFSKQNFAWISHLSHAFHMPHPFHLPWSDHLNNTCWVVYITKFLQNSLSPVSCHFLLLLLNILLNTLFSNTISLVLSVCSNIHGHLLD